MKIPQAALLFFLATQTTSAFSPSTKKFGVRHAASTSLRSTTVKDETLFQDQSDRNGSSVEDIAALMASASSGPTISKAPSMTREQSILQASRKARSLATDYMSRYENQSGAAIVYTKLQENGVTVVNGFSGGAVLPLLDQFHEDNPRHKGSPLTPIRWITNSNESSSGHIAEGYAKSMPLDGEFLPVGVVVATSGPGLTNLITPIQDGMCDGVPMVILCGQAATNAPEDAFQSAPAVEITTPCTKWSYQIKSAAEIPFVMDYAFYLARNGRPGPVFVDLPKDLQNQILSPERIQGYVENSLPDGSSDHVGMASLETRTRKDGEVFKAFRFGNEKKGLSFEISKEVSGDLKMKPISSVNDMHNVDHHPTNRIIYSARALSREPETIVKEGDLCSTNKVTKEMIHLIKNAKKPIIIAGQGCNDSSDELMKFAERLQIPVTTTLHALGCFDERHKLALNMMGMHGHPTPNFMVQESDLIINIGSRFDDRITGRMPDFVPKAKKAAELGIGGIIHVDIRMSERAKQIEPTFFVHSTGNNFLKVMNAALDEEGEDLVIRTEEWVEKKLRLEKEYTITIPTYKTEQTEVTNENGETEIIKRTRLSAQRVVLELNNQILKAGKMDDAIFSTGVGIHQMVTAQLITWTKPRQMLSSGSLGTMGVALGYCIGAKLANCDKMVIAVDGDGSFNMTFTELKTVAEQNIPIKIMILDNESQMMVEYWQRLFHDARRIAVTNTKNPEYTKLAAAFGIKSIICESEHELEEKMRQFLFDDPDAPVLFHVRTEKTPCLPLVAPGQPLDDMILEDVDVEVDQAAAPS
jgi:acetolactate synthase-1/2/3 large subunit